MFVDSGRKATDTEPWRGTKKKVELIFKMDIQQYSSSTFCQGYKGSVIEALERTPGRWLSNFHRILMILEISLQVPCSRDARQLPTLAAAVLKPTHVTARVLWVYCVVRSAVACRHVHSDGDAYVRRPSTRKLLYSNACRTGADDKSSAVKVWHRRDLAGHHPEDARLLQRAGVPRLPAAATAADVTPVAVWRPGDDDTAYLSVVMQAAAQSGEPSRMVQRSSITYTPTTTSRRRVECGRVWAYMLVLYAYIIICLLYTSPSPRDS